MKNEFKLTEVGAIPADWEVKKLEIVGDVKMCRRVFNHQTKPIGAIPFFKIGTFGKEPDAFISEELYNEFRQKYSFPKKGDILISAAGTIGRTIVYNGEPAYFQDSNIVWIDNDGATVSNELLYFIFKIVKYNTEGGTIQRLYNSILKNAQFPLPPTKAEQTAIATALSDMDALLAATQKRLQKKKAIKQGLMQELLRPREGWEEMEFGKICYPSKSRINPLTSNVNYRCIELEHLSQGSGILLGYADSNSLLSQKSIFEKGDVLLGKLRPYLRKYLFAEFDGVCTTEIWVLKSESNVDKKFLFYLVQSDKIIEAANVSIGTKMPRAEWKTVSETKIFLPPPDEQTRIAQILTDADAAIQALETKLAKLQAQKQGMMQALLTGKIRLTA